MSLTAVVDPTVLRAQARIGRTLRDKWRLDRLLGIGGMAAVYAGTHRNGSRGAIKMLHLELSLDPDIKARFLREGYVANAVDAPGVVRVIDDDVAEDGSVFIVMELLRGETLDARWERSGHRLPTIEVLSAIDPLLEVLAAAHEKGIVHRDIKPENVFVTQEGEVKLLDFGVARMREGATTATRTGSTMGTPAFMPPEQALGRSSEVGPTSDIWAVGAMMFTLLSGRFVHDGQTANEQLVAAATKRAPSLGTAAPDVPVSVVALVDRALVFEQSERWQNATEMQRALRDAYHTMNGVSVHTAPRLVVPESRASLPDHARASTETTGAASTSERSVATPSVHRTHTAPIALGVAIAAVGLASAAYVVFSRTSTGPAAPGGSAQGVALAPEVPAAPSAVSAEPPSVAPADSSVGAAVRAPDQGQLKVQVIGGTCALSIDGTDYGSIALQEVSLAPGRHDISCKPDKGRAQKRTARVKLGATAVETFTLDTPTSRGGPPATKAEDKRR